MDKAQWVSSLTEAVKLTPLDFTAPQGYIPIILGFHFPGSPLEATAHVKGRLARTLAKWPCLGGQFIAGGRGISPKLIYSKNGPTGLDAFPNEVFDWKGLHTNEFIWDEFSQLVAERGPAIAMDKDILCLLPEKIPGPGEGCHPVTLRVNFTKDRRGILLGLSLHHVIMDGAGVWDFLTCFAGLDAPDAGSDMVFFDRFLSQKGKFAEYNFDESNVPQPDPAAPPGVARIISITASVIDKLHRDASKIFKDSEEYDDSAYVSKTDISTFAPESILSRNTRQSLTSAEPYLGNAFLRVTSKAPAYMICACARAPPFPFLDPDHIAFVAYEIRKAILSLNDIEHLRAHLSIAANAAHPPDVDATVRRTIDRGVAGVDSSSWLGLGADLNFKIPGTEEHEDGGKPAFIRRAYAPFPGAMNLMPRRGGTKGDADWEVWVALRENDMERLVGKMVEGGVVEGGVVEG
ncbi:hypothetical protein QBC34DRAFT_475916 [Podospora aff. communis PSN243]|uniref:Trichothecene 3-O-acetyltransferase n=1 Tax=Podospora aff. communis PSN243 TaxID=3040156 RepID=A0AAV9G781_9PEZI|nr:hypothetical protein QBC34DRAFT_475916 [Podospora aff. communis PSN243]